MIIKKVNCPNPKCNSLISIPDKSDFYTSSCNQCKEKRIYFTKDREEWIKEMLGSTNYKIWKIKLREKNIKIVYL